MVLNARDVHKHSKCLTALPDSRAEVRALPSVKGFHNRLQAGNFCSAHMAQLCHPGPTENRIFLASKFKLVNLNQVKVS